MQSDVFLNNYAVFFVSFFTIALSGLEFDYNRTGPHRRSNFSIKVYYFVSSLFDQTFQDLSVACVVFFNSFY